MAPNFLIVGERRSGTTTLAHWVRNHPDIYLHPTIDMGYFVDDELVGSRTYKVGKVDQAKWYSSHSKSEYESFFEEGISADAIGEKSADYLFLDQCHERIKSYYPGMKLVVILRNPIDRAWSMYWNEVGKGREHLSFEDALKAEEKRIAESDYARDHLSYFSRGMYASSLKKLFEVFNRNQVHIVLLNSLTENPVRDLKELYVFLGVDPDKGLVESGKRLNKNWTVVPRAFVQKSRLLTGLDKLYYRGLNKGVRLLPYDNYQKRQIIVKLSAPFREHKVNASMHLETRAWLSSRYAKYNEELEDLLGKKIAW
ncbi:MAG: sulfotransferase [Bacteroidota bacterium]